MSILGVAFLNEILNKTVTIRANEILNQLRDLVIKSLHQTGTLEEAKDGMKVAVSVIDFTKKKLQFSGANRPLLIISGGELKELKGDPMPIGLYQDEEISFSNKDLIFNEGDLLYLFSDGYIDQFGGSDRKTFRSDSFKKILLEIRDLPLIEQKKYLIKKHEEWKGGIEQTDDILIVGIKL